MGKEVETMAEGEEAAALSSRGEWYRRLLQAMVWSKRAGVSGYHRLLRSGSSSSRSCGSRKSSSRVRVARLGNNKRAFRLRSAASRMRWRWLSPFSLLAKLRNAYVNLMLSASTKLASSSEGLAMGPFPSHPFLFSAAAAHRHPPPSQLAKQHDRILMDLCMAMAQHQFLCPTSAY